MGPGARRERTMPIRAVKGKPDGTLDAGRIRHVLLLDNDGRCAPPSWCRNIRNTRETKALSPPRAPQRPILCCGRATLRLRLFFSACCGCCGRDASRGDRRARVALRFCSTRVALTPDSLPTDVGLICE
jgi:hypothetical protein